MSTVDREQIGNWIRAAFDFADHVASNPPHALSVYDTNALPAPREWIEKGIQALVIISRDDRSKGEPIQWAMLLDTLRQYQPGVGDKPAGMGQLIASHPLQRSADTDLAAWSDAERARYLDYLREVQASEQRASCFKDRAAKERALDSRFLERVLGLEWQEHLRMAQEFARQAATELESGRMDGILRQLDADRKWMQDYADRTEEAARGASAQKDVEYRNVPTTTSEHEADNQELMIGTTPASAQYKPGMGCQAAATMISEVRSVPVATPPLPVHAAPPVTTELKPEPPLSRPELNRTGSWGAPLGVLGCIIAAGVCASSGDEKGRNACLCWIFIGIPFILIYFRRRVVASHEEHRVD